MCAIRTMRASVAGVFWLGLLLLHASCASDGTRDRDDTSPGDLASEFIRRAPYSSLLVEIDYVVGFDQGIDAQKRVFAEIVRDLIDKPGGLRYAGNPIPIDSTRPRDEPLIRTLDDIVAFEREHRTSFKDARTGTAVLYVAILNGGYIKDTDETKTLGLAYGGSSIALFKETMIDECEAHSPIVCGMLETTILVHELGHILGLVNSGTPMIDAHQDEEHGHHDVNSECVMYWQHESIDPARIHELLEMAKAGPLSALYFDDACKDDLTAVRED